MINCFEVKIGFIAFLLSVTIGSILNIAYGQEFLPKSDLNDGKMFEDQVIVCVPDVNTDISGDHICHLYNQDDLDYYQDSTDGSFFKYDDSFDMRLVN